MFMIFMVYQGFLFIALLLEAIIGALFCQPKIVAMSDTEKPINFIQQVINADLEAGTVKKVVTRFPP